jgi:hypothetical protein
MPRPLRTSLWISALVATFAATARADESVSPVPMIVADKGQVSLVDPDGTRVLMDCLAHTEIRLQMGPNRGQVLRESEPCYLGPLTVHPPTGRWAVSAAVMSSTVRLEVSGREVVPPTDKAGRIKRGDFLILGDRDGVVAVTPGLAEAWTTNGIYHSQFPQAFTADGARVLVSSSSASTCQWWSWSFSPRPSSLRVLAPGVADLTCNELIDGEPRTVLWHPRRGVRIATLDPTGTRPWTVGGPLPQKSRGMTMSRVLGDTLVFFRQGEVFPEDNICDESKPGTYRRVDLRTGQERVWDALEKDCYTGDFLMANAARRTVYYFNGTDRGIGGKRLFAYELDSDTKHQVKVESLSLYGMLDISPDGRTLLLFTYAEGLVLYDVDSGRTAKVAGGWTKDATARLLSLR